MDALAGDRRPNGPYRFAIALMCVAPCAVALFASSALAHRARFSYSGLWFIYEVSFFVGCIGITIALIMAIVEAMRQQIPAIFPWLMAIFAAVGIFLLWYAGHIYQNPWAHKI